MNNSGKSTIIIAGAGQFGRTFTYMLNHEQYSLIAYADNNKALHGTVLPSPFGKEIPVLSLADAAARMPDIILISVTDETRQGQLKDQLTDLHYTGRILGLSDLSSLLDIRSAVLARTARRINDLHVPGAAAELGVYRGDLAWKINALFPNRLLYLFDTFEGFDERDVAIEQEHQTSYAQEGDFRDTSIQAVRSRLPYPAQAHFVKGYFPETAAPYMDQRYAFVSLDADLYAPILAGLEYFVPRMEPGGMILLHDYNNTRFQGAKKAVEAYEGQHGPLKLLPLCDLHGTAAILF
ncbi:MAG: TylF/MycF/NovP-related O-methyltransferase [Lachnospiraceae bacterium]